MSEITGTAKAHEAYAFACMRCGHGWEQSYEIEHHVDPTDPARHEYVVYKTGGVRVPSPLSSPTCANCGGHVVRIMRAGQVSSVLDLVERSSRTVRPPRGKKSSDRKPAEEREKEGVAAEGARDTPAEPHHWHLSDLLHPFRR
ncbi:hypothetical protein ACFYT4_04220 [Streptomyces sp. NPDC004609]|uniref:hypothetical protein n=1 Tax=Streptomyces sp. NPDC004609 TaxID=3364704 RepID=UPI0036799009